MGPSSFEIVVHCEGIKTMAPGHSLRVHLAGSDES